MEEKEKIKVWIRIVKGRTECICPRSEKRCKRLCERDVVERDLFEGWQETARRDRYGR